MGIFSFVMVHNPWHHTSSQEFLWEGKYEAIHYHSLQKEILYLTLEVGPCGIVLE